MPACYMADRVALSKHWGNELSRQVRHAWRAPDMQPLFQADSSKPKRLAAFFGWAGYTLMPCARSTGILLEKKHGPPKVSECVGAFHARGAQVATFFLPLIRELGALTGCGKLP